MSSTIGPAGPLARQRPSLARLLGAGLATVLTAVFATLLLRALLFAVLSLNPAFPPLSAGAISAFTIAGVALGAVVFAIIARRAASPARTFRIVASVALVLSILPNLALMGNPAAAPFPGGSAQSFGVLILFHLVAGIVAITMLPALARTR